jgi:FAD/FMN-containing dehydrogenase
MPVIWNFGRNVRLEPRLRYEPHDDEDVLRILRDHRGGHIRCVGALHSWSRIIEGDDVVIDMRRFDSVGIVTKGRGPDHQYEGAQVRLGGGCTVKRALDLLAAEGLTLPTIGAITAQTIAGAISTGTHGSGQQSLSHFVEEVRLAGYIPDSEEPVILRLRGGDELRAARCALGGLGVILDVVLRAVGSYAVEEHLEKLERFDDLKGERAKWPLLQFALLPWAWTYLVYRRRKTAAKGKRLSNLLLRAWLSFMVDSLLHWLLQSVVVTLGSRAIRWFYRLVPALILEHRRIDDSAVVLTLGHDFFHHVEMELFLVEGDLPKAIRDIQALIELAAGQPASFPELEAELEATFPALRDSWTHHYPISFRYVLPEDTLISMASKRDPRDRECWVAISFFNYEHPDSRGFEQFAGAVATRLVRKRGARPHWGKYLPIPLDEPIGRYPRFADFEKIRKHYDPTGVFWNENLWPRGRR